MDVELTVNGAAYRVECDGASTLVHVLREQLGLRGTKLACGIGYCGACTVLVDGKVAHSCCVFIGDVDGAEVTTIEGMADDRVGRTVIDSFVRNGGTQCGACTAGMVMSVVGLLREPAPRLDREDITTHLLGNMCRCTGYAKIIRAAEDAFDMVRAHD